MGKLHLEDLTKVFGEDDDIVAVEDLSLSIDDGEFLVLVGPSGCGKSTTLRCIAGLETVTSGDIRLDGSSVTHKRPMDRDIAMVFQNYALYPHMTAFDNIAFGLKMTTDLSRSEIRDRVEDAAELMGIEDLLEKKPGELSGGQQQRVALGRAIVREPSVFLMDEPLSNLDAKLRVQMRTELQNLQQNLDVTTVYVTHDQTEAMTMGDQIAVLNGGELQQVGTPLECYHEPSNEFVAGFIGSPSMNFFDVEKRGTRLVADGFTYEVGEAWADQLDAEPDALRLGIRPEDVRIVDDGVENAVETTIDVVEPMGDVTVIYASIGDEQLTVSADGETLVEPNERVRVLFPEDRLHVFDWESGDAIVNRRRTDVNVEQPWA